MCAVCMLKKEYPCQQGIVKECSILGKIPRNESCVR